MNNPIFIAFQSFKMSTSKFLLLKRSCTKNNFSIFSFSSLNYNLLPVIKCSSLGTACIRSFNLYKLKNENCICNKKEERVVNIKYNCTHTSRKAVNYFAQNTQNNNKKNDKKLNNSSLWWMCSAFCALLVFSIDNKRQKIYCFSGTTEEVELGKTDSFEEGKIHEIKVHGGKSSVLVCKTAGKWYCTGAFCSHYSAPLVKGVLTKDHVTCPWHDAEFDIKTGQPINGPALKPIPTYEINEKNGYLVAKLPKEIKNFLDPQRDSKNLRVLDNRVFAIVGGGAAAITAAQTLREQGFNGRVIMITKEEYLPYDRIVLSKNFSASMEKLKLHDEAFFKDFSIEVLRNSEVKKLNTNTNEITLNDGNKIFYDKVLVASGSEARRLDIPGSDLKNIFVIRNFDDAKKIDEVAKKGVKCVVIGSSFIGMEVASTLAKKGASVAVISQDSVPFERTFGNKVGNVFKQLLKEKEIRFYSNKDVKEFIGNAGNVNGIKLHDGDVIQADCVILGVGVNLNTKFIEGISLNKNDNAIIVDPFMKSTTKENVYAAGDIALFPYVQSGDMVRIEHWDVAMQQGRIAARNMCNESHYPYHNIPFFWTMLLGKSLRFAGHFKSFDDVICEGDLANCKFVAYYVKNNKIVGVATMDNDPVCVAVCEAMRINKMPTPSEITLGIANSATIIKNVQESTFLYPE